MISAEESKYYLWLGRSFEGRGAVVELGCWLGRSTFFIVSGLRRSPGFAGQKLHVFDDFIWRSSWMDPHYSAHPPAHGTSFRALFEQNTGALAGDLVVATSRIAGDDDNAAIPPLVWSNGPIELVYVDCGRTLEVNEAWFAVLAPSFVPGETLLVLQDWQTFKETPARSYNQTKAFTDSKGSRLELLHELRNGSVGTFLFRG
jgi:hypothetical protein